MKKWWWVFLVLLSLMVGILWYVIWLESNHGLLTVAFLDIGQGDSIFIKAPNGNELLIDGGPDKKVLTELAKIRPWYDQFIDVVVATHPDADHIGGLPLVLDHYQVGLTMEPGVSSPTATYKRFEEAIVSHQIPKVLARRGMNIVLDTNVSFTILFPDQDVTGWETNDASIVGKLTYGDTSFLLTGDSPIKIEQYLVKKDGTRLQATVLKPGHHGSRTSSSQVYLEAVKPTYAVISAGFHNRYGHPHKEVIDRLNHMGVTIFSTLGQGAVVLTSDGQKVSKE